MSAAATRSDRRLRALRLLPVLIFAASLAIGLSVLYTSHPHEDAYILFKYVRNFTAGRGIVFNAGGPHAEGATDFLWFILLSFFTRIGCDVAVAAALLNALGAGLASSVLVDASRRAGVTLPIALSCAAMSLAILFGSASLAGYVGFSTMLYSALVLCLLRATLSQDPRTLARVPMLALAVALFRPDGLVLGAGFALCSLTSVRRAGCSRPFRLHLLVALTLGVSYFAWRWWYFGLPLPLPLYVKSHGAPPFDVAGALSHPFDSFQGLLPNLRWCLSRLGPAPFVAAALVVARMLPRSERAALRPLAIATIPLLLFLAALSFGRQTQNHAGRFQAPVVLCLSFLAFEIGLLVMRAADAPRSRMRWACAVSILSTLPAIQRGLGEIADAGSARSYVDVFAPSIARILGRDHTIALTEAGRIPYWTEARCEDMVGLNDPRTARLPPSREHLASLDPDVVMFHVAQAYDLGPRLASERAPVVALGAGTLRASLTQSCQPIFERDLASYATGFTPENIAASVMGGFLSSDGGYEVYAVSYRGGYDHVYGIKRGLEEAPAILAALRDSADPRHYRSYAQVAGLWLARDGAR